MLYEELAQRWRAVCWSPHRAWPDVLPDVLRQHFGNVLSLLERQRWPVGQYLLLGPAGRIDAALNAFLTSPAMRIKSQHTQRKYTYALAIWLNFLERQPTPRHWSEVDSDTVDDFKFWRMTDERNPDRVQGSTWHGNLAALSALYEWAARKHGVRNPVVTRELRARAYSSRPFPSPPATRPDLVAPYYDLRTTRAAEPGGIRDRDVKWFTPDAQRRWVDWGLRGLGPDGRDAPVWRGRNTERDAALADLLYGTGLRLQEGGSLLVIELPSLDLSLSSSGKERNFYTCHLAAACAKGLRGRAYWMPRTVRKALEHYLGADGERARAVERAQHHHRYDQVPEKLVAQKMLPNAVLLQERQGEDLDRWAIQKVSLDALTPHQRRRLFIETSRGLEPLALWLNEDGLPRHHHAWEKTFEIANRRIRRLGYPHFVCRPHKLRHSFAFKWYVTGRLLYERQLRYLSEEELRDFRVQFGNTWDLVRTLLGHASIETTMHIYLEPFHAAEIERLFAEAELSTFEDLFRADSRIRTDPLEMS